MEVLGLRPSGNVETSNLLRGKYLRSHRVYYVFNCLLSFRIKERRVQAERSVGL